MRADADLASGACPEHADDLEGRVSAARGGRGISRWPPQSRSMRPKSFGRHMRSKINERRSGQPILNGRARTDNFELSSEGLHFALGIAIRPYASGDPI